MKDNLKDIGILGCKHYDYLKKSKKHIPDRSDIICIRWKHLQKML